MSLTPDSDEDRLEQLSRRIEDWLRDSSSRAETLKALVSEVRREQSLPPRKTRPAATPDSGSSDAGVDLARFARSLEQTTDQAGILGSLVERGASAASRVVLFIVRGESVHGWAARGFPAEFVPRSVSFQLDGSTAVARSHQRCAVVIEPPLTRPGNAELLAMLGGSTPRLLLAAPVWVRDRVAAVLYADTDGAGGPWSPETLCVMATLAALNLEVLPARQKHPRPAAEPEIANESSASPSPAIEFDELPSLREPDPVDTPEPADLEQETQREEALRFARLLASEIVLYNAAELEDGRRHKDIYMRLKDEIDRSHQMFSERFSAQPGTTHCFRNELVRVLAEGDESALTLPWS